MPISVSFNKDLLLLIVLLWFLGQGIINVVAGIFLAGKERSKVYGQADVIAGALNLLVFFVVLLL